MYSLLQAKCHALRDEVIDFAGDLVRIPSPSLQEQAVAERILAQMRQAGFDKAFRDDSGNVVGVLLGRNLHPVLLLNCHMDTVGAGDERLWHAAPCAGTVSEQRLHGLGAADCKGGLAGQLYAAVLLKRCLLPLDGTLVVAATAAEENGCSIGLRALLEKTLPELDLRPDYAVIGEPTGLGLYYGHDGWMEMDLRFQGTNPFHVDDAVEAVRRDLLANSGNSRFQQRLNLGGVTVRDADGWRCSTLSLARRLAPEEPEADVLEGVRHSAVMAAQAGGSVAVAVDVHTETQRLYTGQTTLVRRVAHAWATDPFHPLMERSRQALTAAGCQVRPGRWTLGRLGMGTAGGVLLNDFSIPVIGYGPGVEAAAHAANENVEIPKLMEAVYGTAAIAHSLIGIPVYGWTAGDI